MTRVIGSVQSERERARAAQVRGGSRRAGTPCTDAWASGEGFGRCRRRSRRWATLLIMEAMKMENELRAEAPVLVDSVVVSEGQNVEADAVLVDTGRDLSVDRSL